MQLLIFFSFCIVVMKQCTCLFCTNETEFFRNFNEEAAKILRVQLELRRSLPFANIRYVEDSDISEDSTESVFKDPPKPRKRRSKHHNHTDDSELSYSEV